MIDMDRFFEKLDNLYAQAQLEEAGAFLRSSYDEALARDDRGAALAIVNERMGFCRERCLHEEAARCGEDALRLIRELALEGSITHGTTLLNIATACRAAGRLEEAEAGYREAIEIYAGQLGADDMRLASLYNNLALLYREQGRYEEAASTLKKAAALSAKREDTEIEYATSLVNLSSVLICLGDLEGAEKYAGQALALFEKPANASDLHAYSAVSAMAEVLFAKDRYAESGQLYEKAAQIYAASQGARPKQLALLQNALIAYRRGGVSEAAERLRREMEELER